MSAWAVVRRGQALPLFELRGEWSNVSDDRRTIDGKEQRRKGIFGGITPAMQRCDNFLREERGREKKRREDKRLKRAGDWK